MHKRCHNLDAPVRSYGVADIAGGLGLAKYLGQPHLGGVSSNSGPVASFKSCCKIKFNPVFKDRLPVGVIQIIVNVIRAGIEPKVRNGSSFKIHAGRVKVDVEN